MTDTTINTIVKLHVDRPHFESRDEAERFERRYQTFVDLTQDWTRPLLIERSAGGFHMACSLADLGLLHSHLADLFD